MANREKRNVSQPSNYKKFSKTGAVVDGDEDYHPNVMGDNTDNTIDTNQLTQAHRDISMC